YNVESGETRSMRSKEEANDYRYFPDPDLLPLEVTQEFLEGVKQTLPELPDAKKHRFMEQFGLSAYDASVLTTSRAMGDFYEAVVKAVGEKEAKLAANWTMGEFSGALNKDSVEIADAPVSAEALAGLLKRIVDNTISGKIAKDVFEAMWAGEGDADAIIDKKGLKQITDTGAIEAIIDEVIAENPSQVEEYKGGKEALLGFFVGQTMKKSKGKANPGQVNKLLKDKLG
ncbi:MAG: Asp-tRNA(Asn)/Glu-tRNA(Gln) amidotransferase GatCAB subunit B, partial [Gammaproteobacteria bacterium]|nr:Asp-tRNA(Asn)/Glu-tRNA(Gln) amidotransferase GatCAB subunit B [Gammaproteobacteria bacterium]